MDNVAEEKFKEWLDKNKIPYWYLDQSLESFSPSLRDLLDIKRPDFMILLPNFGFIFVDVKDREPAREYPKFFIDGKETDKYLNMQGIFNMQTWFVISNESCRYETWYWIPISEVTRSGFSSATKHDSKDSFFYAVPINEFVQVSSNDNLERIFSKLFRLDK